MDRQRRLPFRMGCLVLGLGVLGIALGIPSGSGPLKTWQCLGPIQVLAGPDELWIFLEVRQCILLPGRLTSHRLRKRGHFQEVIVLSEAGVKERIRVSIENGVTFQPSISYIFRFQDSFYLHEGESMFNLHSVYQWRHNHFELLPLNVSESLLETVGLQLKPTEGIPQLRDSGDFCERLKWVRPIRRARAFPGSVIGPARAVRYNRSRSTRSQRDA